MRAISLACFFLLHSISQKKIWNAVFFAIVLFSAGLTAQEYPPLQNVEYPYGFKPSSYPSDHFQDWWDNWLAKKDFLIDCGEGRTAPGCDNTSTIKVEAVGWSMIMTAYMGEKEKFDGLLKFYKSKLKNHGMMDWKVSCNGEPTCDEVHILFNK